MKKLLIVAEYFRPGYKAGGPIKSIENLANILNEDLNIYILTRNHDLNEITPYNIQKDKWIKQSKNYLFYDNDNLGFKTFKKINIDEFDYIYLNSLFSITTIKFLIKNKTLQNIFLSPRGELGEGALNLKRKKKITFLNVVKWIRIYKNVKFIGSSKLEINEINNYFPNNEKYEISNLSTPSKYNFTNNKIAGKVNLFFVSRITEKKNLAFLIELLEKIEEEVNLKVIGPAEDEKYYQKCQELIEKLPSNININFIGSKDPSEIHDLIKDEDYFILPTLNENYGHVIAEALSFKKPVIVSDETPWNEYIIKNKLGYVLNLNDVLWINSLKEVIKQDSKGYEKYASNFRTIEEDFQNKNDEIKNKYLRIFK
ncbi:MULTISPECIES: glycosyltransferase [Staphylococcus]|uniref:glycosyltransferase n=1 Tax=Staphylococcus TaxID=1279 RepID=UPI0018DBAE60|nr:glycosyltransferase [Staphylococcus saprophyticus]QPW17800.1 glycosyltransferase [Staphylococcus saprophyticus]